MKKAQGLDPLPEKTLSQDEEIKYWLGDDKAYNDLAVRHNNLIDHITKFCQ